MLTVGLSEWYSNHDRAVAMVVVGSLCELAGNACPLISLHTALPNTAFLPGIFACYIMVGTALRWRGFSYSQIPAYDD